jgi:phosphoserine phosphatase
MESINKEILVVDLDGTLLNSDILHESFYLAKDSRLNKLTFQKSETRIQNFRNFRDKEECFKVFRSSQSQRLEL